MKVASIAFALVVGIGSAQAEVFELSYTENAIRWNQYLDQIARTLELEEDAASEAKALAVMWTYMGPCEGSAHNFRQGGDTDVLQFVLGAKATSRFEIAVLAMIGTLNRESLGRKPPADLCTFALDMSNAR